MEDERKHQQRECTHTYTYLHKKKANEAPGIKILARYHGKASREDKPDFHLSVFFGILA